MKGSLILGIRDLVMSFVEENYLFSELSAFTGGIDECVENYLDSDGLIEINPGSINVPLENLITNFQREIVTRELELISAMRESPYLLKMFRLDYRKQSDRIH